VRVDFRKSKEETGGVVFSEREKKGGPRGEVKARRAQKAAAAAKEGPRWDIQS